MELDAPSLDNGFLAGLLRLRVKAAMRTCLVAWSIPRLFTLRIVVKLISVPSTGSSAEATEA